MGGPQVKRVVLLGSAVSVLDSFQDMSVAGADYTEEDWNPVNPSYTSSTGYLLTNSPGDCRFSN
jgi:hypothetical protein